MSATAGSYVDVAFERAPCYWTLPMFPPHEDRMNDKPEYQIGLQQTPDGWHVMVLFEPCATQEDALKMCHIVAPWIQEAVGGTQGRVQ